MSQSELTLRFIESIKSCGFGPSSKDEKTKKGFGTWMGNLEVTKSVIFKKVQYKVSISYPFAKGRTSKIEEFFAGMEPALKKLATDRNLKVMVFKTMIVMEPMAPKDAPVKKAAPKKATAKTKTKAPAKVLVDEDAI